MRFIVFGNFKMAEFLSAVSALEVAMTVWLQLSSRFDTAG